MKKFVVWAVVLAGLAYGGAKAYLHSEVADSMDLAVLLMSPYANVEYAGVRSTMSGELTIEGIRVKLHDYRDEFVIDRLGIDTPSFLSLVKMNDYMSMREKGLPDSFGVLIEGLHLRTDADFYQELYEFSSSHRDAGDDADASAMCSGKHGFSPGTLQALGYSEQVFSMAMTVHNRGRDFTLQVTSGIEDMWEIDAELALAGDLLNEMLKGAAYRPRLSNLTIDYTDRSLNSRVRKLCESLGLSEEQTLQAQMEAFKFQGESIGIVFDEYLLEPYLQFLKGKERIVFTAKPNEPIAMSQIDLYKASDVPALLNLEAQVH